MPPRYALGIVPMIASIMIFVATSIASTAQPSRRDLAPSHWSTSGSSVVLASHVVLSPTMASGFGSPNTPIAFQLRMDNLSGSADTFDLFSAAPWPMTFFRLDGVTPLIDTDNDGHVDTGSVSPNFFIFITVKITPPASATIGQVASGTLTVRSSNDPAQSAVATYSVALPAPFAQSYTQDDHLYVSVNRFWLKTQQQTTAQFGYEPALTIAPTGQLIQIWEQGRTNNHGKKVYELFATALDGYGKPVPPTVTLTDLSAATLDTHDHQPAIAVAPDGNLGVLWYRAIKDGNGNFNDNVYFMILNLSGSAVLPATNLTNNTQYGTALTPNVPQFFEPIITATPDNRFALAWRRQLYTGSTTRNTLWIAVRSAVGTVIKAPAQFDSNTCSYHPHLTPLADGSVFLVRETCANVSYARLNSSGALLNGSLALTSSNGNDSPVAAQLANGNILLAWQHNLGARFALQYALLNSALTVIKNTTDLPSISPVGDKAVSITRAADKAVLTWTDVYTYQPHLYYALLDNSGQLVTPPFIFATDPNNALSAVENGQGNTFLLADTTPPNNPTTLTSPSHIVNQWSNDNTIDVMWSGASDSGGSGLAGYSIGWDASPTGLPDDIRDVPEGAKPLTSPPFSNGTWYFHLRALDNDGNAATTAIHLGPFKIDTAPPQSSAQSPLYAIGPFTVTWNGNDVGSNIVGYNVWVRDGSIGTWTVWLSHTTTSSGVLTGTIGHTTYFRSQAIDAANNLESDLPGDGDTHTMVAAFQIDGQVFNNRHAPIFNAMVNVQPNALNLAQTNSQGAYTLYLANSGAYTITIDRGSFGVLPPRHMMLTSTQQALDFVLPPVNDAIINGGWETGDFAGWSVNPMISATVEMTAAHTGRYGLRLDGSGSNTEFMPYLTQTLTITNARPTLSYLYRVAEGSSGLFVVKIMTDTGVIIQGLIVTPGNWTHNWLDLSAFASQTVTLTLSFQNPMAAQQIDLDEISLGDTQVGVYPVFLPVVRRSS